MSTEPISASDEIDLFKPFVGVLRFFYKGRKVIFGAALFGFVVGLSSFFLSPKIYKSRMTCESAHLADGRVIDLILDLQTLLDLDEYAEVSRKTGIPVKVLKNVEKIEAISFAKLEQESKKDKEAIHEAVNSTFGVEVLVKDLNILPVLEKGIVYYLSNNDYAKRKLAEDRKQIEATIESLKKQQLRYDSLNTAFTSTVLTKDRTTMLLGNPFAYKMQVQEIYERILEKQKSLALLEEIRVIQDFSRVRKPASPKLVLSVIGGISTFTTLVVLFLIIRVSIRKIRVLVAE